MSIRALANEAGIAKSVIQNLRSGKQHDIKVSNLIKIANAFGYTLILQKRKGALNARRNYDKELKEAFMRCSSVKYSPHIVYLLIFLMVFNYG